MNSLTSSIVKSLNSTAESANVSAKHTSNEILETDANNNIVWENTITTSQVSGLQAYIQSIAGNPSNLSPSTTNNQALFTRSGAVKWDAIYSTDVPKTLDHTWTTDFDTQVNTHKITQLTPPTSALSMNSQKIQSVADGSLSSDAATINNLNSKFPTTTAGTYPKVTVNTNGLVTSGTTLSTTDLPSNIPLSNLSSGSNGQAIITSSGVPTWSTLTHSNISDFTSSVNSLISSSYPIAITNLSNSGATSGQVLTYNGSGNVWQNITIPTSTYQLTGAIIGSSTNTGSIMTTSYASGSIVDANVSSTAAIQVSKVNVNSNVNFNGHNITNLAGFSGSGSIIYGTTTVDMGNNNLDTVGTLYCSQIQPVTSGITIGGTVSFTGSLGANLNVNAYNLYNVGELDVTIISSPNVNITISKPIIMTDSGYTYGSTAYAYLNSSGSIGTQASSGGLFSLKTNNRILCAGEIDCYSSKNFKNIISSTTDIETEKEAVELFSKIPLFKYDYKDKIKNGDGYTYGVIAEELKNIAPTYIKDDRDYVPNIMQLCSISKKIENYYTVVFKTDLKIDNEKMQKKIKFYCDSDVFEGKIFMIGEDSIIVECDDKIPIYIGFSYFCYGTYEDCPSVNKNKIFELNMVATQYLIKQNNELIKRIEKLENQVRQFSP